MYNEKLKKIHEIINKEIYPIMDEIFATARQLPTNHLHANQIKLLLHKMSGKYMNVKSLILEGEGWNFPLVEETEKVSHLHRPKT